MIACGAVLPLFQIMLALFVMPESPRWLVSKGSDCNLRQGARHLKGTYKGDLFTYSFGFFGPLWAHMGPARALEEREKFKKSAPFF